MKNEEQQLEALQDIRKMMKDSSKFLSLSGLSGVFAGIYALTGAYLGHITLREYHGYVERGRTMFDELVLKIVFICFGVLVLSIFTAFVLSSQKAKKTNQRLFDHTSKRVFWSMAIPLMTGGLLCIAFLYHGMVMMVAPAMLLFYGMALLNSSKHTIPEIRFLSYFELALGLVAAFNPGNGLVFWALGFGVLHIIYGTIMWNKYDRHL